MEEYLFYIPTGYQKEVIFAVFFCANISRVNSILRKLESYEGVKEVKNFIGTRRVYYQDWLKREVDKRISQKYCHYNNNNNIKNSYYIIDMCV